MTQYLLFEPEIVHAFRDTTKRILGQFDIHSVAYNLYLPGDIQIKSAMSRELIDKWIKNDMLKNCPVLKLALSGRLDIIQWNTCYGSSVPEIEMMEMRKGAGLYNGITFVNSYDSICELTAWSSGNSENEVDRKAIYNSRLFQECIDEIRIIAKDSKILKQLIEGLNNSVPNYGSNSA